MCYRAIEWRAIKSCRRLTTIVHHVDKEPGAVRQRVLHPPIEGEPCPLAGADRTDGEFHAG